MRAGTASPSDTRRRRLAGASLVLMALTISGCYQNPDPKEWGKAAEKNFVAACTTDVTAKNGTTTSISIQTTSNCECIYDKMVNEYNLSWDDMKAYEDKQASAKAGAKPPTPPKALTKAIAACAPEGPGL